MDITYKVFIAVIAGLLVFTIMRKMTKWIFRGIILLLFIGGLFYAYSHIDDIKAVFNEEIGNSGISDIHGELPIGMQGNATAEPAANETMQNITEEIIIVEPIAEPAGLPLEEPLPEQLPA